MQQNLVKEFGHGLYARIAEMSEAHFSRQFKRSTGLSPSQYFIGLRIAVARRLLRETDRSIISIGMEVGYSSPSHFSQVFHKETGVSRFLRHPTPVTLAAVRTNEGYDACVEPAGMGIWP